MLNMVWTEEHRIHIPRFDNEHRLLFGLLDELADVENLPTALQKQVHMQILLQLQVAIESHFTSEETFMQENAYPADLFELHRKRHRSLVNDLQEFVDHYQAYSMGLNPNMVAFLHEWLYRHIITEDRQMGEYFLKQGGGTLPPESG